MILEGKELRELVTEKWVRSNQWFLEEHLETLADGYHSLLDKLMPYFNIDCDPF